MLCYEYKFESTPPDVFCLSCLTINTLTIEHIEKNDAKAIGTTHVFCVFTIIINYQQLRKRLETCGESRKISVRL